MVICMRGWYVFIFFFCKQKTAYEMRISDWSSDVCSSDLPVLGLSNGARSGLHGFVAGVSRQVAKTGVTINNLLPGRFLTDRLKGTIGAQRKKQGAALEAAFEQIAATIPAGRFGTAEEFGKVCAFILPVQAAHIPGPSETQR